MNLYRSLLRPLLFRFPAETAHEMALTWLQLAAVTPSLLRLLFPPPPPCPVHFAGLQFPNPVGLAAGMDKNGLALSAWGALGFGFVEVGTITAHPQPGNPHPRLFRYPAQAALVNRMGFNNHGCAAVARRLEERQNRRQWPEYPLGLNLGKSKITPLADAPKDYLTSYQQLYPFADYMVINVSSPNTPGLRSLQAAEELRRIVQTLREWEAPRRKPLWVKLAPDLSAEEMQAAAAVAAEAGADALVATNTTLDHSSLPAGRDESGGLSGAPLRDLARRSLARLRDVTDLPLVAVGGIMTAPEAVARRRMGAGLVQLYTGFVYEGPALVRASVQAWRQDMQLRA